MEFQLISHSVEETHGIGRQLATCLQPGDVVLLRGDLGAGKTQLVQGVAAGLGTTSVPISPTFNIVISYVDGRLPLHHFDLYRFESASQLEDIGLAEYLESGGVCFVEWAEKFPEAFNDCLEITIEKRGENDRLLTFELPDDTRAGRFQVLTDRADEGILLQLDCDGEDASSFQMSPDALGSNLAQTAQNTQRGDEGEPPADGVIVFETSSPSLKSSEQAKKYVLVFDTANEIVAVGIGELVEETRSIVPVAVREVAAHRESNTTLLPTVDAMMQLGGLARSQLACIAVGRGPGSFTGVRIALASAKGIAQALGLPLVGLSTLGAIAWNAQLEGVRGDLLVIADAMRKEVYPTHYHLGDVDVTRLDTDSVIKAEAFAQQLKGGSALQIIGDGLVKYRDLFSTKGQILSDKLWEVSGRGLLQQLQQLWKQGLVDPFDAVQNSPAAVLPVYTRLSDAEENERARSSAPRERNLVEGVQSLELDAPDVSARATMHNTAKAAFQKQGGLGYRPLVESDCDQVGTLEAKAMGSDAWTSRQFVDELGQRNRVWWVASCEGAIVGYAGGLVVDGDLQILKVATDSEYRRQGIARELLSRVAEDARNLGAHTCSLEVRTSNQGAQAFYRELGLEDKGTRPRYYSDHEDALIMAGPLPVITHDVGGMQIIHHEEGAGQSEADRLPNPLILAIESSCDETAAALIDGSGMLLSDVVASQIDFHARFGGVVPEIASRKHIEAICGVCSEALVGQANWNDLDAVAVTYAPGLLGGLVVGVSYGKGVAWALDIPFIGVNHLEGHLYANKLAEGGFEPPAVVSLVSGGNTLLIWMRDWGEYEILGSTIDDAVGEAFDKISKALGLGYPGGPIIGKLAEQGDPAAIPFPRALLHSHDYRFSLSGLKTAVVNYINGERAAGRELNYADIAASFQQAVIDVQVAKAQTALQETGAPTFCLGGGVAANAALRRAYEVMCSKMGVRLIMPPLASCGDNAGMIALVALDRYRDKKFWSLDADALAHADLSEPY